MNAVSEQSFQWLMKLLRTNAEVSDTQSSHLPDPTHSIFLAASGRSCKKKGEHMLQFVKCASEEENGGVDAILANHVANRFRMKTLHDHACIQKVADEPRIS